MGYGERLRRLTMDKNKDPFDSYGVVHKHDPYSGEMKIAVYGYGTYGPTSVLAGSLRRVFLDWFDTEEEAYLKYPKAHPGYQAPSSENESLADASELPKSAPDWFDPAAAGESWDEDY